LAFATAALGKYKVTGQLSPHIAFALVAPLAHATLGIAVALALGLSRGDALLFTALCASASYIAVPAAIRHALPEASPGVYVPMALASISRSACLSISPSSTASGTERTWKPSNVSKLSPTPARCAKCAL